MQTTQLTIKNGILVRADKALTSVTIPDGVTTIGGCAFRGCSSLASVTIPDGVTSISDWAFDGCSSLASVTIPDGVTTISYYAFDGCSSLASVTIPNSVTTIGYYAFRGCGKKLGTWHSFDAWLCGDTLTIGCRSARLSWWKTDEATEFALENGFTKAEVTRLRNKLLRP